MTATLTRAEAQARLNEADAALDRARRDGAPVRELAALMMRQRRAREDCDAADARLR